MREQFIFHKFSQESLRMLEIIDKLMRSYERQGYKLSLRQLYYQLVARDYIPNSIRSYKNTGNLVSTARQAGLLDWAMIEDRNRETVIPSHWRNPGDILDAAAAGFHIDKWQDQPYHVEVMVEKDALSGVLVPVCRRLDIGLTANKGYSSSSTMYEIGKRLERQKFYGKDIRVLYLGDHDPSGIDMSRDVEERLAMYSRLDKIEVLRLALNWDQIEQWKPPENPAKETDSRFAAYVAQYGESSWELDAVEPVQLASLVEFAVTEIREEDLWDKAVAQEDEWRDELEEYANKYD